jgi:hypothetical protein
MNQSKSKSPPIPKKPYAPSPTLHLILTTPYHRYKEHVLRGGIEHGFPAEYTRFIEQFESKLDSDQQLSERERCIYQ